MRKKFKKAMTFCYSKTKDCVEIIFQSPASNQLRLQKEQAARFRSYSQLKRYQKYVRKVALRFFMGVALLFVGILMGPAIFEPERSADIYIPSGKGDILISNVSKNQASVVFKTLDAADENKPLATTAVVEAYLDPQYKTLFKSSDPQDYAVTHIVPLYGLQEGQLYYLRIKASESKSMENSKDIGLWGGSDPIVVYASGETVPTCVAQTQSTADGAEGSQTAELADSVSSGEVSVAPSSENNTPKSAPVSGQTKESLRIMGVQNESYLHGRDKVQTIISWETNNPSSSILIYRNDKDGKEEELKVSEEMKKEHAAVLTTLKPGEVYYFKVKSESASGESVSSSEYSLRTPRARDTILEMVGNNFKSLMDQIGL
ncbi:MAG: hypothetical protein UX75_C0007G0041 [Candidatus Moranbacteria bacterium GW2011_GWE2_47_10]|nr:MAG: hypothetical protein UX75_C0007G0041 [Candidatus Moranbacteria bacterium GW2011_GWE2_47_10]HBP01172.1 hypothetical protein [Candidatus Moranbacteria bacterium]